MNTLNTLAARDYRVARHLHTTALCFGDDAKQDLLQVAAVCLQGAINKSMKFWLNATGTPDPENSGNVNLVNVLTGLGMKLPEHLVRHCYTLDHWNEASLSRLDLYVHEPTLAQFFDVYIALQTGVEEYIKQHTNTEQ